MEKAPLCNSKDVITAAISSYGTAKAATRVCVYRIYSSWGPARRRPFHLRCVALYRKYGSFSRGARVLRHLVSVVEILPVSSGLSSSTRCRRLCGSPMLRKRPEGEFRDRRWAYSGKGSRHVASRDQGVAKDRIREHHKPSLRAILESNRFDTVSILVEQRKTRHQGF